jgi:predicted nucleic acid-binding protein
LNKVKIYLDACCWCRPFDDQMQSRVRLEAEAVLSIIANGRAGGFVLAGSEAIEFELSGITDADKFKKICSLYSATSERLLYTGETRTRALLFQQQGIKTLDSLHLALAEEYRQDILLTTDDAFIAAAERSGIGVPVANPVTWLMKEIV